jgi:hypothetical protein
MKAVPLLVSLWIATLLPGAYERGPLWWAILGTVLCAANAAIVLSSTRSRK